MIHCIKGAVKEEADSDGFVSTPREVYGVTPVDARAEQLYVEIRPLPDALRNVREGTNCDTYSSVVRLRCGCGHVHAEVGPGRGPGTWNGSLPKVYYYRHASVICDAPGDADRILWDRIGCLYTM